MLPWPWGLSLLGIMPSWRLRCLVPTVGSSLPTTLDDGTPHPSTGRAPNWTVATPMLRCWGTETLVSGVQWGGQTTFYLGKNDFVHHNADVTHNMYQSLAAVARLQLDLQASWEREQQQIPAGAALGKCIRDFHSPE